MTKTRLNNDVALVLTLTDNGVAVDWKSVTIHGVLMYSDDQKARDGACSFEIDSSDSTKLHATWAAEDQSYLGDHRVIVLVEYDGRKATYDAEAITVVASTESLTPAEEAEAASTTAVDVTVAQVSTSLLDAAISAAFEGADEAEKAAETATKAAEDVEAAKKTAVDAATAANTAASKANTAASDADTATSKAKSATNSANAAALLANAAATKASTATDTANAAAESADSAAETANAAAANATTATASANKSAANADSATGRANSAASSATSAAESATSAAGSATTAAASANEAAETANTAAAKADAAREALTSQTVQTVEQTLTEDQQTQARTNIAAAGSDELATLSQKVDAYGDPKTYFDGVIGVSKSYFDTFAGNLYSFTSYLYCYLTAISGKVKEVDVQCNSGAVITIYKYDKGDSKLTTIASAKATSDGVLTIDCKSSQFDGEYLAFGTSSKLGYRSPAGEIAFGVINKNGNYYKDASYDYSIKIKMESESKGIAMTSETIDDTSDLPISSKAIVSLGLLDFIAGHKIGWSSGKMTSSGTVYDTTSYEHSDYVDANGYFKEVSIYIEGSTYAYVFFDQDLFVVGGYRPESAGYLTIKGRLNDVPKNARYVVFNQQTSKLSDIYYVASETINTKWAGKNVLFFGDSFIDQGYLVKQVCNILGCNAINRGVSGSVVASLNKTSYNSLVDRLDGYVNPDSEHASALPDSCDAVIVNCSTNDWGTGVSMGSFEDGYSDKTTFYGGLHYVVNKLVEKYGNIPILWIEATHRASSSMTEFTFDSDGKITLEENAVGKTLRDYVNALREVCEMYSIPIVSAYGDSRIQPYWDANKTAYTVDGLHPNDKGGKLIALKVLEKIWWMGV